MNLMIQQGWQCPCCSKVYSPTTPMCLYCPPKVTVASNSTPQREWKTLDPAEIDQGLISSGNYGQTANAWRDGVHWAQTKLKEKNA